MPTIDSAGLHADVPSGWEGEIYSRPDPATGEEGPSTARSDDPAPDTFSTMSTAGAPDFRHNFLHLATFPLPPERADYGNGAVQLMGPDDIFVAILEHPAEDAAQPLFAPDGLPRLTPGDFRTDVLHRTIPGHSGHQRFFHVGGRAFCLYIVLGSHERREALVPRANQILEGLRID